MSWQRIATHAWQDPLAFATRFANEQDFTFLYSARKERFSGQQSFLLLEPRMEYVSDSFASLPEIPADEGEHLPYWTGYIGYGARCSIERYSRGTPSPITLPDVWLTAYRRIFRFHHLDQTIEEFYFGNTVFKPIPDMKWAEKPASVATLHSNMTRREYESAIHATLDKIRAGDFYQANITRKFYGTFADTADAWSVYKKLCAASPAPYSAFIKHGSRAILSSSPECFLSIDREGNILSRPIKGSARRGMNEEEDQALRHRLAASEKNIAENLMIVDLMRNDLSRVSAPCSVNVSEHAALYSYATIHHLVSTIHARRLHEARAYDVVRAAFPPGSMTGAPKIAAIEWCTEQEKLERGVYSGVIGWFGPEETCDLSVVIRTLVMDGNQFEFQVGGGIVADSTVTQEWQETLIKARGIVAALGINEAELAAL